MHLGYSKIVLYKVYVMWLIICEPNNQSFGTCKYLLIEDNTFDHYLIIVDVYSKFQNLMEWEISLLRKSWIS